MKVPILSELKANGIDPEYLFWVGCAGSFDERSKKVTKAFITVSYTHMTLPTIGSV